MADWGVYESRIDELKVSLRLLLAAPLIPFKEY